MMISDILGLPPLGPGEYETDEKVHNTMKYCDNCESQDHPYGDTYATDMLPCEECHTAAVWRHIDNIRRILREVLSDDTGEEGLAALLLDLAGANVYDYKDSHKFDGFRCAVCRLCYGRTEMPYTGVTYNHYPNCLIADLRVMLKLKVNVIPDKEASAPMGVPIGRWNSLVD